MGVSTLWLNLFFQTPSQSHYQSEREETRRAQRVIMVAEMVWRDRLSPGLVCFQTHSPTVKLLNKKSEGSRRAPVCLLSAQEIKDPAGNRRVQLLKQRLDGVK